MLKYVSYSEKETKDLGKNIAKKISFFKKTQAVLLFGDLGSGKTAFTKGFANFFGLHKILSPTFNIIKLYEINNNSYIKLIHVDLYRIKNIRELYALNFFQYMQEKNNILIIEWPNIIPISLYKKYPIDIHKIYFSYGINQNERIINHTKI